MTTARMASSPAARSSAAKMPWCIAPLMAFSTSGRLSMISATPSAPR
jgi:hypothetical protein